MTVGEKIKEYTIKNDIQQTWLSIETKMPLPKLNLALNGKRRLTFDEYELICGVLGIGVDTFLTPKLPESQRRTQNENVS